jgi:hypothetical protein
MQRSARYFSLQFLHTSLSADMTSELHYQWIMNFFLKSKMDQWHTFTFYFS